MRVIQKAFVFASIVVLASGCLSGTTPSAPPGDQAAGPGEGTGTVQGVVVDDQFSPLSGVAILLLEDRQHSTVTNHAGSFILSNVLPGTYTFSATRVGFQVFTAKTLVVEGEIVEMRILLTSVPRPEPRIQQFRGDGFIALGIAVADQAVFTPAGEQLQNKNSFYHELTAGAEGTVSTAVWTATSVLPARSLLLLTRFIPERTIVNETIGASPLTVRMFDVPPTGERQILVYLTTAKTCNSSQTSSCTGNLPGSLVSIFVQQRVTVYTDIFYHMPAPEQHQANPDT